jgi:hypothetical protein
MSKDRITINQLIRIAEERTWEDFEAMPDGRLILQDHAQTLLQSEEPVSPLLWIFEMRIGLHFERPMQAIMSCGHFIRMRSADISWGVANLGKLDPARPDNCLYDQPGSFAQTGSFSRGWRPYMPQTASNIQSSVLVGVPLQTTVVPSHTGWAGPYATQNTTYQRAALQATQQAIKSATSWGLQTLQGHGSTKI